MSSLRFFLVGGCSSPASPKFITLSHARQLKITVNRESRTQHSGIKLANPGISLNSLTATIAGVFQRFAPNV